MTEHRAVHPLDPLSADEIRRAAAALRRDQGVGERWRFASIELREPPKRESISRQAEVICWNRDDGRVYKARVDSVQGGSGAVFSLLPPENATGNYVKVVQRIPVKLVLERGENAQHLLVPGMSVVPTITLR